MQAGTASQARPSLNKLFRLQFEPAQNAHVLLFPEGMVKLNPSAAAILERCDGKHTVAQLIDALEAAFNTSGLQNEVRGFLEFAGERNWIEWSDA
jgi:pyrroloquinoline quinone biosynthesis protein D